MKTIFLMYTKYISEFKISPEDRKISFSFAVCRLKKTNYLYSCLNVKELLARNSEIRSLSDCNWTRTQKHLVRKRTLNHLAKLSKWLSCALSTYLYGAFDCMHHTDKYSEHSWIIWAVWPIVQCLFTTKWFWVRFQLQSLKKFIKVCKKTLSSNKDSTYSLLWLLITHRK